MKNLKQEYGKKYEVIFDEEEFMEQFGGDTADDLRFFQPLYYSIVCRNGEISYLNHHSEMVFICNSPSVACELSSVMGDKIRVETYENQTDIYFNEKHLGEILDYIDGYERRNEND